MKDNNNSFETLLKTDIDVELGLDKNVYDRSRDKMSIICKMIDKPNDTFEEETVVTTLLSYVSDREQYLGKILYSQISAYVYGLQDEKRSSFLANCERLRDYSLQPDNNVDPVVFKAIVKICDHVSLADQQKSLVDSQKMTEFSEKQDALIKQYETLDNDLRSIKTDHVEILGLFSGIVLAFFGGLVFSSSVLENIHQTSAYRLAIAALLIAAVVLNVVFICFWAIDRIVHKNSRSLSKWPWIITNSIIALLAGLIGFLYFNGCLEQRDEDVQKKIGIHETTEETIEETK